MPIMHCAALLQREKEKEGHTHFTTTNIAKDSDDSRIQEEEAAAP